MGPVPPNASDEADDQEPDDKCPADGSQTEDEEADVGECACRGHAGPESPVPKKIQNLEKLINTEPVAHLGLPSTWHGIILPLSWSAGL
jgi:hypothetical protein